MTAAGTQRRRGWWRSNVIALLALVLIVPGTVFVVLGLPALAVADRTVTPTDVAANEPVSAQGFTWELTTSKAFVGTGSDRTKNQVPVGTSLIAALITVTPTSTSAAAADSYTSCDYALTSRSDPSVGERSWSSVLSLSDFNYNRADDTTAYCDLSSNEPFELEVVFLAPSTVYSDATVDVTLDGATTQVLRFSLVRDQ